MRESNARFVRWSDGSLQLVLGDEVLDVKEIDTRWVPAQAGSAAHVTHATCLLWALNAQAGLESMGTGRLGLCSSCSTKHLCWDAKQPVPVHGGALELPFVLFLSLAGFQADRELCLCACHFPGPAAMNTATCVYAYQT